LQESRRANPPQSGAGLAISVRRITHPLRWPPERSDAYQVRHSRTSCDTYVGNPKCGTAHRHNKMRRRSFPARHRAGRASWSGVSLFGVSPETLSCSDRRSTPLSRPAVDSRVDEHRRHGDLRVPADRPGPRQLHAPGLNSLRAVSDPAATHPLRNESFRVITPSQLVQS